MVIPPISTTTPSPTRESGLPGANGHRPINPCRLTLPRSCGLPTPCGQPCHLALGPERHAVLELGSLARLVVIAQPGGHGTFHEQAGDLFAQLACIVRNQPTRFMPTTLMVFLRCSADEQACRALVSKWFGTAAPVTTYVTQPPCDGAALGVELWAMGGPGATVTRLGPQLLTAEADGIRWIYAGDIRGQPGADGAYAEAWSGFEQLQQQLTAAGARFDQVVRTWLYVNHITSGENGRQRYQELNRARTDFYHNIRFGRRGTDADHLAVNYPASTGIGTNGSTQVMACMALDSHRPDVFLLPLENPQQMPAYNYQAKYSPQSPKFSRAMAVVQGHFVSTLVSGTASIVEAKTAYPGQILRQTRQTIENIERLIAPDNFARHGLPQVGATLRDVAKLRVYVKDPRDYESCRAEVERRLPRVPAMYLQADICRPDLLVEIEAVAFSPLKTH